MPVGSKQIALARGPSRREAKGTGGEGGGGRAGRRAGADPTLGIGCQQGEFMERDGKLVPVPSRCGITLTLPRGLRSSLLRSTTPRHAANNSYKCTRQQRHTLFVVFFPFFCIWLFSVFISCRLPRHRGRVINYTNPHPLLEFWRQEYS